MAKFAISLAGAATQTIGHEKTNIIRVADFFSQPADLIDAAAAQNFARINPHYPGIRAGVDPGLLDGLCAAVAELVANHWQAPAQRWQGQAWYSIVTAPKEQLTPIQRLPHFDGFDESQLAIMIYLNHTGHGGTAFYRQKHTGFETITEARFPTYKAQLETGVRATGLPPAQYVSDGAPHFEKITDFGAEYNSLILYPGTALHSGVIDNQLPLPADPRQGRLTINGFFRPA